MRKIAKHLEARNASPRQLWRCRCGWTIPADALPSLEVINDSEDDRTILLKHLGCRKVGHLQGILVLYNRG